MISTLPGRIAARPGFLPLFLLFGASLAPAQSSLPVRDIDAKGKNAFQSFTFATAPPLQTLNLTLAKVPENKRLVIDFLAMGPEGGCLTDSALFLDDNIFNGARFSVSMAPNSRAGFSIPLTLFVAPGDSLTLKLVNSCQFGAARQVLVAGHFVSLP